MKIICWIACVCSFLLLFNGCVGSYKNNKDSNYNEKISEKTSPVVKKTQYSQEEIQQLRQNVYLRNMTCEKLKSRYDVQYDRETYQGLYYVLLQDDGKRVFVFSDRDSNIYEILVADRIKTKKEFQKYLSSNPSYLDVLKYDTNFFSKGYGITVTYHVVQEGLFVLTDTGFVEDGVFVERTKVIAYLDNDEILSGKDEYIRENIPFILECDRCW